MLQVGALSLPLLRHSRQNLAPTFEQRHLRHGVMRDAGGLGDLLAGVHRFCRFLRNRSTTCRLIRLRPRRNHSLQPQRSSSGGRGCGCLHDLQLDPEPVQAFAGPGGRSGQVGQNLPLFCKTPLWENIGDFSKKAPDSALLTLNLPCHPFGTRLMPSQTGIPLDFTT